MLNQLNEATGFYKHWSVGSEIESITRNFPNVYQIAFFNCGREHWCSTRHTGCFESRSAAEEHMKQIQMPSAIPEMAEVELNLKEKVQIETNLDEQKSVKQITSFEEQRLGKSHMHNH